jgi:hypothetical protein
MRQTKTYWFPAKHRGWGWGLPSAWQGKVVLAIFYVLVAAGAYLLLPRYGDWTFVAYCVLLCGVLMAICWITGEPPGRR